MKALEEIKEMPENKVIETMNKLPPFPIKDQDFSNVFYMKYWKQIPRFPQAEDIKSGLS